MISHAATTVAEHLYEDVFRICFSTRDARNRSHIGCIEVDINVPFRILKIADDPLLAPGEVGTFDDSGVSLSCINKVRGQKYLYYVGWNLGVTVPWRNTIGLAIYKEEARIFERYSKAPLLGRHPVDPYSISYPFILEDQGSFRMWYGSNLSWGKREQDMAHVIKYAESSDGIEWVRRGTICLNFKNDTEYALSRPAVVKDGGTYKMWYSYRGKSYRIGYAESDDGIYWERLDERAGIGVSESGWDSEMICYPFVFDHKGARYMLYNGNGYGRSGFGLAVLEN